MVSIKGFEMPESCRDCPICYDLYECPIGPGMFYKRTLEDDVRKWYDENPGWFTTKRHLLCPLEERSGKWKHYRSEHISSGSDVYCSSCEHFWINDGQIIQYKYCPHCGAEMVGE